MDMVDFSTTVPYTSLVFKLLIIICVVTFDAVACTHVYIVRNTCSTF